MELVALAAPRGALPDWLMHVPACWWAHEGQAQMVSDTCGERSVGICLCFKKHCCALVKKVCNTDVHFFFMSKVSISIGVCSE